MFHKIKLYFPQRLLGRYFPQVFSAQTPKFQMFRLLSPGRPAKYILRHTRVQLPVPKAFIGISTLKAATTAVRQHNNGSATTTTPQQQRDSTATTITTTTAA